MERLKEKIITSLSNKDFKNLKDLLNDDEVNDADIAEILDELSQEKALVLFRMLKKDTAASVFSWLSVESQHMIISASSDKELANIIEELYTDDAVDALEELPANVVRKILESTSAETRNLINQFLNYPEDSAGSIMTSEYIGLKKKMTVAEAFSYIRQHAVDKETIYTCYVTDANRYLEGIISVRTLILHSDDTIIEDIMLKNYIYSNTNENRELVVDKFNKYDLLSIPVVDNENRLVGIVTIDDALDVMEQEATEDFEKMAAISPSEKPYLKTSAITLAKNRITWLIVLMLADTMSGSILRYYDDAIAKFPLLVAAVPMLIDTGGNAGNQSSTMIIRGLAIGEVKIKDFFKVIFKELQVGLIAATILASVNLLRLVIMSVIRHENDTEHMLINVAMCLSIYCIVVFSKLIGAMLPMFAVTLKMDPAIMAGPLITTVVDAFGLIIYFLIVGLFLPI